METTQLGPYRLLERVGVGGMAEVFRAERDNDDGSKSTFAIKRLTQELSRDPKLISMFTDEASLALQLRHPGIVRVMQYGTDAAGRMYMVLEFVDGHDLRWCLATAARARYWLPVEFALTVARELAYALAHAHDATDAAGRELNIVHRDVTHSNVFVSFDGETKLADFGIARARGRQAHTRTGLVRGKVGYLSPEQVRALPLDGRSDLFAATVVLWELLTQRRMFVGETDFKTMLAVCNGKRLPPSKHRPGLPPELDNIVLRGVAVAPEHRFQHAALLGAAIDEIAQIMGLELGSKVVAEVVQHLHEFESSHSLESPRRPSNPHAVTAQIAAPPVAETRKIPSVPFPDSASPEPISVTASNLQFVEPWESTRTSTAIAYGLLPPENERNACAATPWTEELFVKSDLKVVKVSSFEELLRSIDPRNVSSHDVSVSVDAMSWMPIGEFAPLAELDFALYTPTAFRPAPVSRERRTVGVLGGLALRGATGAFVTDRQDERYTCLMEVGGIVGLMSTRPSQQMIPALAAGAVVPDPRRIGAVFHHLIINRLPLAETLRRLFETDPELVISFRKTMAIDVLEDILALEPADFAFTETPGWSNRGFLAGTALELVARATHSWAPSAIDHALGPSRERPMEIRPDFPLVARMLRLRKDAAPVLRQLKPGRTLEHLFGKFPEGSETMRMAKSLAFIFLETGAIQFP